MMHTLLKFHAVKLLLLMAAANISVLIYLALGELKPAAKLAWMDIIGEGGATLLSLVWIGLVLKSRPAGRVTNLLVAGLGCIFFSWWVDCLDEFIQIADDAVWDHVLESGPMPLGMILLTFGIYHWHSEQLAISKQMEKRERVFREHRLFDKITPLGSADYLRKQLQLCLQTAEEEQQPLSLVMLDLDNFSAINQQYGHAEGDRLLQTLTQFLLLNLRTHDLLCRLAGDRFVAVLPCTGDTQARQLATALGSAVQHFAYHTHQGERLPLSAGVASIMALGDTPATLLDRLNLALARSRQPRFARTA